MLHKVVAPMAGWGMLPLRLVVGVAFVMHGGQKLFVYGVSGTAAFFGSLGIPAPLAAAVVVTFVEFLGGIALVIGFRTRWAAVLLAIDMLVAIVTVHLRHGFFVPDGIEFPLILLGATLTLMLAGPGAAAM